MQTGTIKQAKRITDKACHILRETEDGNLLPPFDLKIIESAVNGHLNEDGRFYFNLLFKKYNTEFLYKTASDTLDSLLINKGYLYGYDLKKWEHTGNNRLINKQDGREFLVMYYDTQVEHEIAIKNHSPIINEHGQRVYDDGEHDPDPRNWYEFLALRDNGDLLEITENLYYYFLEVLPPKAMPARWKNGRWSFAFAEGAETRTYFKEEKGHFYCQRDINGPVLDW